MPKTFPKFAAHRIVSCFNCEGDLIGDYVFESGHPKGRGQWQQCCEKCGMTTWYDCEEKR